MKNKSSVRSTNKSTVADTILIYSEGPHITGTNFWQTDQAALGHYFVSFNAGTARLLVPRNREASIHDLTKGVWQAVLTFGYWHEQGEPNAMEWMAENGSDAPFSLCMCRNHLDETLLVPRGYCLGMRAAIWIEDNGRPKLHSEMPAFVRSVSQIPHLQRLTVIDPASS